MRSENQHWAVATVVTSDSDAVIAADVADADGDADADGSRE